MARKLLSFSLRCHCVTVQRGLSLELSYHLHGCTKAWDWRMAYCLLVMTSCRSEQSSYGARLSPIPRSTGQSSRDGGWHGDPCLRLWELVRQGFFFPHLGMTWRTHTFYKREKQQEEFKRRSYFEPQSQRVHSSRQRHAAPPMPRERA